MSSQSPRWLATARVLRRAGFGATGPQIDAVASSDWSAYLDTALGLDPDADPGAVATPRPTPVTPPVPPNGASKDAVQQFTRELFDQMTDLTSWWVRRMAAVHEPIHEAHAAVAQPFRDLGAEGARRGVMGQQNQKLRILKLGDFPALAHTMLTDAAMLFEFGLP